MRADSGDPVRQANPAPFAFGPSRSRKDPFMDRRHFLETLAAGLVAGGSVLPTLQSVAGPLFVPVEKDEEGLTPLRRFFAVAIVSFPPKIDVEKERLEIEGAVTAPFALGYDELSQWPQHTQESILRCVGGAQGRARWVGVRLHDLLETAGVAPDARDVIFYGADEYESSVPVGVAMKESSMLALQMNDEPLWSKHGSPVRLVLPGMYGYKQVKWLTRIEVTRKNHKGYWEQRGYSDDGRIKS